MTVILIDRDPGDETDSLTDAGYENPRAYDRPGSAFAAEDRFLIDASELERLIDIARGEGYAEGYGDCLTDHNIDAAVC